MVVSSSAWREAEGPGGQGAVDCSSRVGVRNPEPPGCLASSTEVTAKAGFGLCDPYGPLPTSDILYSVISKTLTDI